MTTAPRHLTGQSCDATEREDEAAESIGQLPSVDPEAPLVEATLTGEIPRPRAPGRLTPGAVRATAERSVEFPQEWGIAEGDSPTPEDRMVAQNAGQGPSQGPQGGRPALSVATTLDEPLPPDEVVHGVPTGPGAPEGEGLGSLLNPTESKTPLDSLVTWIARLLTKLECAILGPRVFLFGQGKRRNTDTKSSQSEITSRTKGKGEPTARGRR